MKKKIFFCQVKKNMSIFLDIIFLLFHPGLVFVYIDDCGGDRVQILSYHEIQVLNKARNGIPSPVILNFALLI